MHDMSAYGRQPLRRPRHEKLSLRRNYRAPSFTLNNPT